MTAQASTTYDEMPYINKAFPQTHPDRLATLARLFGVTTADIDTCPVLAGILRAGLEENLPQFARAGLIVR